MSPLRPMPSVPGTAHVRSGEESMQARRARGISFHEGLMAFVRRSIGVWKI